MNEPLDDDEPPGCKVCGGAAHEYAHVALILRGFVRLTMTSDSTPALLSRDSIVAVQVSQLKSGGTVIVLGGGATRQVVEEFDEVVRRIAESA